MSEAKKAYRVKVWVDGKWKSSGDFRELDRAREHARMIAMHLERHVEIRDVLGRLIECNFLTSAPTEAKSDYFEQESISQTVVFDDPDTEFSM